MNARSSCYCGLALILFGFAGALKAGSPDQVRVNRTVPKVSPPKTELEFSAHPTAQEIFRARVFEEPLAGKQVLGS